MEKKLTAEEAEAIAQARDIRRTKLLRQFCKEISELPEDFTVGYGLTEEKLQEYFRPIADRMYQYMKDEGMSVQDSQFVEPNFKLVYGYTLERIMNFSQGLIQNALLKHFGVSNIVDDFPMQRLEEEGLHVLTPEEIEELGKEGVE